MKQRQQDEREPRRDHGALFKSEMKDLNCVNCKTDLGISLHMNFGFNPRKEGEPNGITLYKVQCSICKDEAKSYSTNERLAAITWNQYQSKKLGNSAK